jgi:hypothetical protein
MKLAPLVIFATIFLVSFSVQADNFLVANNPVNEAPAAVTAAPANTLPRSILPLKSTASQLV